MCILLTVWQKILKQQTPFICFLFVWFSTCLCLLFHWSLFFNSFAPRPFLSLCGFFISNFRSFSAVNYFFQSFDIFFPAPVSFNYICLGKKNLISTRNFFSSSPYFFLKNSFQLFKDKKFRFSSVGIGLWNSFFSWVNNVIYFCFKICFVAWSSIFFINFLEYSLFSWSYLF